MILLLNRPIALVSVPKVRHVRSPLGNVGDFSPALDHMLAFQHPALRMALTEIFVALPANCWVSPLGNSADKLIQTGACRPPFRDENYRNPRTPQH